MGKLDSVKWTLLHITIKSYSYFSRDAQKNRPKFNRTRLYRHVTRAPPPSSRKPPQMHVPHTHTKNTRAYNNWMSRHSCERCVSSRFTHTHTEFFKTFFLFFFSPNTNEKLAIRLYIYTYKYICVFWKDFLKYHHTHTHVAVLHAHQTFAHTKHMCDAMTCTERSEQFPMHAANSTVPCNTVAEFIGEPQHMYFISQKYPFA